MVEYWNDPVGEPGDHVDRAIEECWNEAQPEDWKVEISKSRDGDDFSSVHVPAGGLDVVWEASSGSRVRIRLVGGESGWVDKSALCRFYLE